MSELRRPIKDALRDSTPDAARVRALWSEVEDKLAPRRRARLWVAAPLVAAAAVVVLVLVWRWPSPHPVAAGPLVLSDGSSWGVVESQASARALAFANRSAVTLEPDTVLEPLVNDGQRLELALRRGRARFEVAQDRPLKWILDCDATIEVLAPSRFAAWKSESGAGVEVFEGALIVRGPTVAGGVQRLAANGKWTHSIPVAPVAEPAAPPAAPAAPPRRTRAVPSPAQPDAWRPLAKAQKFDQAYEALGPKGVAAVAVRSSSIEELMQLADVARLSGHPAEAVPILGRAVDEFASDRRAGLAAFTRGRVQADDLHEPARAADSFARAIAIGLPDLLVEDAFVRLVEARLGAGNRQAALEAMRQYQLRFPDGRKGERIKQLLEPR